MKTRPTLITPRLRLRPFELSDGPAVQHLAGDREVAATTLRIPHPYPDGAAESWIAQHEAEFTAGRALILAVTALEKGQLLGSISLTGIERGHKAELGYWIGRPFWSQGYCTEAGKAVMEYAFEAFSLIRIHAHHFARNEASGRVLKKLGMQHEGTLRRHIQKWGRFEDIACYALLRDTPVDVSAVGPG